MQRSLFSSWRTDALALGLICALGMSGQANAAACYSDEAKLPAATMAAFTAEAGKILQEFPEGGGQMIARIRDLLASDSATLPLVIGLLPNANSEQKSAIGTAFAQAARICIKPDQAYAAQLQQAVVQTNDQTLMVAYSAAAGDQPIAATAIAGVALGGLGGGVGGANGATGNGFGNTGTGTPTVTTFAPFSFTSSAVSFATIPGSSSAANSVSP